MTRKRIEHSGCIEKAELLERIGGWVQRQERQVAAEREASFQANDADDPVVRAARLGEEARPAPYSGLDLGAGGVEAEGFRE